MLLWEMKGCVMLHQDIPTGKTVTPDSKGRITLGKLAEGISSFRVSQDKDGRILLDPYVEIPAREQWLYKNPEALKRVLTGLEQSRQGLGEDLGDFTQFLDDDDL